MNNLLQAIKERRTIRKYQNKPISDELLNTILEAGRWAQSWANTQCWHVIVVRDEKMKKELQKTLPSANPAYNAVVDAPILLCLCAKKNVSGYYKGNICTHFGDWLLFDMGIFAQNIALSAYSLGLGTVIVSYLDHKLAHQVLNLGEDMEFVALMPLGYPVTIPSAPPRKKIEDFVQFI